MKFYYTLYLSLFVSVFINTSWFDIQPIYAIIKQDPSIQYQTVIEKTSFCFDPFIIDPNYPQAGVFDETFIIKIPNGKAQSFYGFTIPKNNFIKEMIWANQEKLLYLVQNFEQKPYIKIPGTVSVISQICYHSYSHWLNELLGRLALLEINNVEYDWLYVPYNSKFAKETLNLWGISESKIINPLSNDFQIQADMLIIPSLVINTDIGFKHIGLFTHPITINYVRNKLLSAALKKEPTISLKKRIFISRNDASFRRILNEDELFKYLKNYGFERYELSSLSVTDQILLFNNAEIIIGEHGTGLANILFCKPQTIVIELFQALKDASFWYLANTLNLQYIPIKTTEFIDDYMTAWKSNTYVSFDSVYPIIKSLLRKL